MTASSRPTRAGSRTVPSRAATSSTIPASATRFVSKVGLLEGATSSDGVVVKVVLRGAGAIHMVATRQIRPSDGVVELSGNHPGVVARPPGDPGSARRGRSLGAAGLAYLGGPGAPLANVRRTHPRVGDAGSGSSGQRPGTGSAEPGAGIDPGVLSGDRHASRGRVHARLPCQAGSAGADGAGAGAARGTGHVDGRPPARTRPTTRPAAGRSRLRRRPCDVAAPAYGRGPRDAPTYPATGRCLPRRRVHRRHRPRPSRPYRLLPPWSGSSRRSFRRARLESSPFSAGISPPAPWSRSSRTSTPEHPAPRSTR